jgi:hypothetical protein
MAGPPYNPYGVAPLGGLEPREAFIRRLEQAGVIFAGAGSDFRYPVHLRGMSASILTRGLLMMKLELDMKISKLAAITLAAFTSVSAASAIAQEATAPAAQASAPLSIAAGQTIYGPAGEAVATVVSVADGNVVVDTGTQKATLPSASFTAGEKGATIGFSKDELNAAIEAANKQAAAGHSSHQPASGAAASNPEGGQ